MQFLGLMTMPALISVYPYLPEPVIGVESNLPGVTCDIPRIFRDTLRGSRRQRAYLYANTRIVVERLPDRSWSFGVFLRFKSVVQVMAWRLRAATCERAARRTALKLEFITESLREDPFLARRQPSAIEPPLAAAIRDTAPVVQRPSRSGPYSLAEDPGAAPIAGSADESPATAGNRKTTALVPKTVAGERRAAPHHRRIPIGMRMRWAGRTGYGVLPDTAFGGGQLTLGLVAGRASVELGGTFSGGRPLVIPEAETRRAYHTSLQLHGCGEIASGTVSVRLCLGLEGGVILTKTANSAVRPWTLHITGSQSVTWWWHPHVGLNAAIAAGPALVRSVFYLGPGPGADAPIQRSVPALLVSGSLGLEFRFPALRDGEEQRP